jgi:uncharacterized protein YndB with AHSA1/START domain
VTIRKSIHVKRPIDAAFRLFTVDIGRWWPLKEGFSFGGDRADQIHLECRAGGRFFERFSDGEEYDVGAVTVYDPPGRIVFTWSQRDWSVPTEVEVRFTQDGGGTRVDLEHRGWESAGDAATRAGKSYDGGWDFVLARYAAA